MRNILFIIWGLFTFSFASSFIITLRQLRITQSALEQMVLVNDYLNKTTSLDEQQSDIHKENFIKFLSESRDWAFDYIDTVQTSLTEFVDAVEPDISYFDKYGIVASSSPHYDALKRISVAYAELKKLLPQD